MMLLLLMNISFYSVSVGALANDQSNDYSEPEIKAALTYNILHFVDWPSKDLLVCVYSNNQAYINSFKAIPEFTKSGDSLTVQFLKPEQPGLHQQSCDVVFIGDDINEKTTELLQSLNQHQLTIGETNQFIQQGGMINFVRKDFKIKFEVNVPAFDKADLKISSQVLRIAERVYNSKDHE